ncbi:G-protein coupled receptor Mth2-like [Lucilia sericata]|uniref:G-protein coupled receptor Mth2-like n=1 Tax=Lucilia sericata TaxID=13632 RepID=UPI0018A87365|nr:G-protein coupled receptor Mth2-like [Lucilia sericata]
MYLLYLTITYSLICYNTLSYVQIGFYECITIGYVIYFGTIAFLTWISIISYDTYVSLTDLDCTTLFRRYFKWGFVIPGAITFIIIVIQSLKIIDEKYKPGIDNDSCGVRVNRWSAFFYYYIPHIIVLVYCTIMYLKLIRFLVLNERNATVFAGRLKTTLYEKIFPLFSFVHIYGCCLVFGNTIISCGNVNRSKYIYYYTGLV